MHKIHDTPQNRQSYLKQTVSEPMVSQDGGVWVRTRWGSLPGTSRGVRKGQKHGYMFTRKRPVRGVSCQQCQVFLGFSCLYWYYPVCPYHGCGWIPFGLRLPISLRVIFVSMGIALATLASHPWHLSLILTGLVSRPLLHPLRDIVDHPDAC
jgi:hypothetical protein